MKIKYLSHYGGDRRAALTRGSKLAACYDLPAWQVYADGAPKRLTADSSWMLTPGSRAILGTGFAMDLAEDVQGEEVTWCADILPRSGLGARGIVLSNTIGIVDADYRGEIIVALYNAGSEPFNITGGMRVAQMRFVPLFLPEMEVVDEFATVTGRGVGGFGSTGVA